MSLRDEQKEELERLMQSIRNNADQPMRVYSRIQQLEEQLASPSSQQG